MKARRRRKAVPLTLTMADLTLASWETIARRTLMMAQNTCSAAEYRRMVHEKAQAALESTLILVSSGGQASLASVIAPWHKRAAANAKRLRKKKNVAASNGAGRR